MADNGDIKSSLNLRVRPVLDLADDLRKIGVQEDIPIPQIAVMGDQSAGKSSVLEAISGIAFPRGTGLVTRCATQITMSRGDTPEAEIRAGDEVRKLRSADMSQLTRHIEELTSKLCGGLDNQFSSDAIEIKLTAPNVPDLTIIDLPGIVRTATGGQDANVISKVDALLKRYLVQERTIVMAVVPANCDIATIDILERASKVDPEGCRTIGVLTKPDLVDRGAEQQVLKVLANITKPLKHGYYMLKNRSQQELNGQVSLSREEARTREREYFKTSAYSNESSRLGVDALTAALTELLVSQIRKALPQMRQEVNDLLEHVTQELDQLGEAPPETAQARRAIVSESLRDIVSKLRQVTTNGDLYPGQPDSQAWRLLQQERAARKDFKSGVEKARPPVDGEADKFEGEVQNDVVQPAAFGSGGGGLFGGGQPSSSGGGLFGGAQSTSTPAAGPAVQVCGLKRPITKVGDVVDVQGGKRVKITKVKFCFRDALAARIENGRGRELPGFMSFAVFTDVMAEHVRQWKTPTDTFRCALKEALLKITSMLVDEAAKFWPALSDKMKAELSKYVRGIDAKAAGKLHDLLSQELVPATENHYLYDTINKIRNDRIAAKLQGMNTTHEGFVRKDDVFTMLKSTVGDDSNESQEVQDMIDYLAAYWKVAAKRYIDVASMIIGDTFTSPKIVDEIDKQLGNLLLAAEDADIEALLKQSAQRQRRRSELIAKRDKMREAKERIDKDV